MSTYPFSFTTAPRVAPLRHWLRLRPARGAFRIGEGWMASYLSMKRA